MGTVSKPDLVRTDPLKAWSQDPITQLVCIRGHGSKVESCLSGTIIQLPTLSATYHVLYKPRDTFPSLTYSDKHERVLLMCQRLPRADVLDLRPEQKGPPPSGFGEASWPVFSHLMEMTVLARSGTLCFPRVPSLFLSNTHIHTHTHSHTLSTCSVTTHTYVTSSRNGCGKQIVPLAVTMLPSWVPQDGADTPTMGNSSCLYRQRFHENNFPGLYSSYR
jgi:hypothetical protein